MNLNLRHIFVVVLLFASAQVIAQQEPITLSVTKISKNKKYGKSPETAIEVGTVGNEYDFLDLLCGPNGEKIEYERIESCCEFDCPTCFMGQGLLDKWEIKYAGLKKPMIIYLNGYIYDNPQVPKGLRLK